MPAYEPAPAPAGGDPWRQRSAGAAVVAAMMLGLRDVLEPPRDDEPPIVIDDDGQGHDPEPVTVYLHPDVPEATLVVLRPPSGR